MRYRTFRGVVVAGALLSAGGAVAWCVSRPEAPPAARRTIADPPPPEITTAPATPASPTLPSAALPAALSSDPAASFLAERLGKPAGSDKIKDALGSRGPKVNVYNEKGTWARAKVDRDRDEKWDEKWWLDGRQLWRAVSSGDDEKYDSKEMVTELPAP